MTSEDYKLTAWDWFTGLLSLTALVVGACALNGVWWPFWYATLPVTAPLFLIYYAFSDVTIAPMAVVIGLLTYIAITISSKKA